MKVVIVKLNKYVIVAMVVLIDLHFRVFLVYRACSLAHGRSFFPNISLVLTPGRSGWKALSITRNVPRPLPL